MNDLDRILDGYDSGALGRRELLAGLTALLFPLSVAAEPATATPPLFRGAGFNHVTMFVGDVQRSKAFYTRLAGLPVRAEGPGFCELRCGGGFLGLYARGDDPTARPGIDHFCIGVNGLEVRKAFETLRQALPSAEPALENDDTEVYVRDPDGLRVQLSHVNYKR